MDVQTSQPFWVYYSFIYYVEQIRQNTYGDIPLCPVAFPGYVFTSNTGDDTGIQLALSKDTRVGIKEFIFSGKVGKQQDHESFNALLRDLSLRSAFNFFTCNQSECFGISLDPFVCSLPNYFGFTAGLDFLHNFIAATEVLVSATKPV